MKAGGDGYSLRTTLCGFCGQPKGFGCRCVMGGEPIEGEFSPKAMAFLRELGDLCEKHQVTLATSGYDGLQVWDMREPSEVLYCAGVEDMTKAPPNQT